MTNDNDTAVKDGLSEWVEARKDFIVTEGGGALIPKSLGEAMELAKLLAGSEMVPKDFINKPGNVFVAIQMGLEVGLPPMQAIQNIAVINGRPALWGDAILAVVSGHRDFVDCVEMDLKEIGKAGAATCTIKRKGREDHTVTFSVEDAQKAKLWGKGGPWTQYPNRMLQMRARAFACRNMFADALRGIQCAEEMSDIPQGIRVEATVTSTSSILDRVKSIEDVKPPSLPPETIKADVEPEAPVEREREPGEDGEMTAEQEREAFGEGGE